MAGRAVIAGVMGKMAGWKGYALAVVVGVALISAGVVA